MVNDMSTNNGSDVTNEEVELRLEYNEYVLECAASGTKALSFKKWSTPTNSILTPIQAGTVKVKTEEVKGVSKSDLAKVVYARHVQSGVLVRKNVISEFVSEAGLTPAGAGTYYANIGLLYKKDPTAFLAKYGKVEEVVEEEVIKVTLIQPEEMIDSLFDSSDFDVDESQEELVD